MHSTLIDQATYEKMVQQIPICCVDIFPVWNDSFFMARRVNDPGRGEWFPVGGRIFKGEKLIDAAARKMKEELGITLEAVDFSKIVTLESIFTGEGIDQNRHSVNTIFKVELATKPTFTVDSTQLDEQKWFSEIDPFWHPYVQEALQTMGFNLRNLY